MYKPCKGDGEEVMTLKKFRERCEGGMFIDYDGFGYLGDGEVFDQSKVILPSDFDDINLNIDVMYTHVVWFNR